MGIFRDVLLLSAASFCVAGCSSLERPELASEDVLPLSVLTATINCELRNAIHDRMETHKDKWLLKWQGQYSITLKANQISFAKLSTSTFPIVLPRSSLLNFGIGAGYTGTANRTALFKFNINFKDIEKEPKCTVETRSDGHPFLMGEIGFREWMDRAIDASGDQNSKTTPDRLSSIGHTFEFSVDVNGALSPSFVIMPAPAVMVNPTVSIDRVDDSIVDVSFGKIPDQVASLSDFERLLSKDQKKEKAKLTISATKANNSIFENTKTVNTLSNIGQMELNLSVMKSALSSNMQIQELAPQSKNAIQKNIGEIEQYLKDHEPDVRKYKAAKAAIPQAQKDLDDANVKINQIDKNPDATRVTNRVTQSSATLISPDANPNVTNTMLQLTLERLAGARFPGQ